jgi:hypothetical protein
MWDPKVLRPECYNIYLFIIVIIYYLPITILLYHLFCDVGSKSIEIGIL